MWRHWPVAHAVPRLCSRWTRVTSDGSLRRPHPRSSSSSTCLGTNSTGSARSACWSTGGVPPWERFLDPRQAARGRWWWPMRTTPWWRGRPTRLPTFDGWAPVRCGKTTLWAVPPVVVASPSRRTVRGDATDVRSLVPRSLLDSTRTTWCWPTGRGTRWPSPCRVVSIGLTQSWLPWLVR